MSTAPLTFLERELPPRFAEGLEQLRAATGPSSREHLDDVLAARGAVRFVIEGEGEVWLAVDQGTMSASRTRPEGVPARVAIAFAADVAREALSLLTESGQLDDPEGPKRFARTFSARVEKALEGQKLEFHVLLRDVPDREDDVVIQVGIGTDTPPAKPQFTAAVSYDDLEDMRGGDLTPQQVIGRLRLTGDASRAMALGMSLMQQGKPVSRK